MTPTLKQIFRSLAVVAGLLLATPASAQVAVVGTDFNGELDAQGQASFRIALVQGLERAGRGTIISEAALVTALDDASGCRGPECMSTVGERVNASIGVTANVNAEADIYDYTVRVYDLSSGELLAEQIGDCTFCPIAEARESFAFTAEAALAGVAQMPIRGAATPAPEPVATDMTATVTVATIPEDAQVLLNGEPVGGEERFRQDLEPGSYVIEVQADGYSPYREEFRVRESMLGSTIFVRVVLSRTAPERVVVERFTPADAAQAGISNDVLARRRAGGGVAIGTGIVLVAAGAVLLALDGQDTCATGTALRCPDVYDTMAGGAALTSLGAFGVGLGVGLLSTSMRDQGASNSEAGPSVEVRPAGAGVSLRF
ncbi:MAG: hypothetical protein ACI81R_000755 [Bradymonadia bacterium]|jgi:hypothetical protein